MFSIVLLFVWNKRNWNYCGIVTTFWRCDCSIAATFISFWLPVSIRPIFGQISEWLLCTSLMAFILHASIVPLSYSFKYINPFTHNIYLRVMYTYTYLSEYVWFFGEHVLKHFHILHNEFRTDSPYNQWYLLFFST